MYRACAQVAGCCDDPVVRASVSAEEPKIAERAKRLPNLMRDMKLQARTQDGLGP